MDLAIHYQRFTDGILIMRLENARILFMEVAVETEITLQQNINANFVAQVNFCLIPDYFFISIKTVSVSRLQLLKKYHANAKAGKIHAYTSDSATLVSKHECIGRSNAN